MSNVAKYQNQESKDQNAQEIVIVGEGNQFISIKTYQDIYNQITGKTEQISRRYKDDVLLDLQEIEQLNYKINQLCDVHKIIASNVSITVFHTKERKEQFTSLERFRLYNASSTSPTVSVLLRYNFSIIPAGNSRPQEYTVNVHLISKVAALKELQEEAPPFIRRLGVARLLPPAVEVSIDYVDYVIARSFLEAVDEWVKGCNSNKTSGFLLFIQRHSNYVAQFVNFLAPALIICFAYQAAPDVIEGSEDLIGLTKLLIVFLGGAYMAIDNIMKISYVKLNRGDEQIIKEAESSIGKSRLRVILNILGAIVIGIIASKLERLI